MILPQDLLRRISLGTGLCSVGLLGGCGNAESPAPATVPVQVAPAPIAQPDPQIRAPKEPDQAPPGLQPREDPCVGCGRG